MVSQFEEEKSSRKLALLKHKEAEESTALLAQKYALPYLDLARFPIEIDAIKIVSEQEARAADLAVFQAVDRHVKIGVRNPAKPETIRTLARIAEQHYTYDLFLVSPYGLEHAWEFYKKVPDEHRQSAAAIDVSGATLASFRTQIHTIVDLKKIIEVSFSGRTSEALEILLAGALSTDASDIHIEPQEEHARLRLRLDGVLHDAAILPLRFYQLLLSRIKLVSELKLNIHDKAQDGHFTIHMDDAAIEVRVSTLPGPDGENTVMRVLNPHAIAISFDGLGMQPWVSEAVRSELKKPNGLILTTGPTGSGKTTTLYTFLRTIASSEVKVITIEDPIEYHLPGIEQTQVDQEKGYDFATGLRAIVRQDPDVILVGEIRDIETAETAMHASLTGHLVFSTLHTNDAAGTIPRLVDLGVKPPIIAPAINIAMGQRLIRKLCTHCRVAMNLDRTAGEKIRAELDIFPAGVVIPDAVHWSIFTASVSGCSECSGTGYRGRTGVYEIILIDDGMEKLILQNAPGSEIKKEAARQGQITMRQDGILKILAGLTDFAELERIVGA